ncbi:hypothetical protein LINPERHAP1_LOCUS31822, partial [Linum perenne]
FSYPIRENLRREELHPWKIHLPSYEDPSPTCVLRLWLQVCVMRKEVSDVSRDLVVDVGDDQTVVIRINFLEEKKWEDR